MYLQNNKIAKKNYNKPNLVIYGDVSQLTQDKNINTNVLDNYDGSSPAPNNKTGF